MTSHDSRRARLRAVLLIGGSSLGAVTPIAMVPALPALAAHFGASGNGATFAEMVMTAPTLTILFGAPLVGLVADRLGARICLLASLAVYTLSGTAGLIISGMAALIASRALLGLATAGIMTLTAAMIAEYYDGEARKRFYGLSTALSAIVSMLITASGGWLIGLVGWRAPFFYYLCGVFFFAIAASAIPAGNDRGVKEQAEEVSGVGDPGSISALWSLYLSLLAFSVGLFTPFVLGPFLLEDIGVTSALRQGEFLSCSIAISIPVAASFGLLNRLLGEHKLMLLTALLLGTGLIMIAHFRSTLGLVGGFLLVGSGSGLVNPSLSTMILGRTPLALRGAAAGAIFTTIFFGQLLTPVIGHFLEEPFGRAGTVAAIGIGLLWAAAFIALPGMPHRRTQEIPR